MDTQDIPASLAGPDVYDAFAGRETDAAGRVLPGEMSDRALLIELVTTMRGVSDALDKFGAAAQGNPMLRALIPGL